MNQVLPYFLLAKSKQSPAKSKKSYPFKVIIIWMVFVLSLHINTYKLLSNLSTVAFLLKLNTSEPRAGMLKTSMVTMKFLNRMIQLGKIILVAFVIEGYVIDLLRCRFDFWGQIVIKGHTHSLHKTHGPVSAAVRLKKYWDEGRPQYGDLNVGLSSSRLSFV